LPKDAPPELVLAGPARGLVTSHHDRGPHHHGALADDDNCDRA
jgi:hypothetical protein